MTDRTAEHSITATLGTAIASVRQAITSLGFTQGHAHQDRDAMMVRDARAWSKKLGSVLEDMAEVHSTRNVVKDAAP